VPLPLPKRELAPMRRSGRSAPLEYMRLRERLERLVQDEKELARALPETRLPEAFLDRYLRGAEANQ
jgi:hypothetical protein